MLRGGAGNFQCEKWCDEVLENNDELSSLFKKQHAELGEAPALDRYATRILTHFWLETAERDPFIADGTAGQYEKESPEGFYGFLSKAPSILKKIYLKKVK